jgi:fumarate hydratase subunit alpha
MKTILSQTIAQAVEKLFLQCCIAPAPDALCALQNAYAHEASPQGREALRQLLENAQIAQKENMPCCQDTGMAVVFLEIGQDVLIEGDLHDAVNTGVRNAYEKGYFRKSVLHPITRINTKDNTPAIIHTEIVSGDTIKITAAPKGFGSENMSAMKMLKPSDGIAGIQKFILDSVLAAGGSPCPPVILGIGIGGTFEMAAFMAKKQLLRPLEETNSDAQLASLEKELKYKINALGLGPMGLGGSCYCLGVHIAAFPTHIAGLPVAVNFQCHASRHATEVL